MNIFVNPVSFDLIIGIDHYSFELKCNQPFHGFKNIPQSSPKIHVVHFQYGMNELRYGYWFEADISNFIEFQFDKTSEIFVPSICEKNDLLINKFGMLQQLLVPYPQIDEDDKWNELTMFINWKNIKRWNSSGLDDTDGLFVYVDSSMATAEEHILLKKSLSKLDNTNIESSGPIDQNLIEYTPISFISKDALRDDFKTIDYLDKSWYLNNILERYHHKSIRSLLGELQYSFLNSFIFSNYGSSLQWHNIIELICQSSDVNRNIINLLDNILTKELFMISQDYLETLVNESVWNRCIYNSIQADNLCKTRAKFFELIPQESELNDELEDSTSICRDIDSDDEFKPVVVRKIIYTPRDSIQI